MTGLTGWQSRAAARGAMTEGEFIAGLRRLGYVVGASASAWEYVFTHLDTGDRRYVFTLDARGGETFSAAFQRIEQERRSDRQP